MQTSCLLTHRYDPSITLCFFFCVWFCWFTHITLFSLSVYIRIYICVCVCPFLALFVQEYDIGDPAHTFKNITDPRLRHLNAEVFFQNAMQEEWMKLVFGKKALKMPLADVSSIPDSYVTFRTRALAYRGMLRAFCKVSI
jgi:hypothetical protein